MRTSPLPRRCTTVDIIMGNQRPDNEDKGSPLPLLLLLRGPNLTPTHRGQLLLLLPPLSKNGSAIEGKVTKERPMLSHQSQGSRINTRSKTRSRSSSREKN
jgi:hypothetical protein